MTVQQPFKLLSHVLNHKEISHLSLLPFLSLVDLSLLDNACVRNRDLRANLLTAVMSYVVDIMAIHDLLRNNITSNPMLNTMTQSFRSWLSTRQIRTNYMSIENATTSSPVNTESIMSDTQFIQHNNNAISHVRINIATISDFTLLMRHCPRISFLCLSGLDEDLLTDIDTYKSIFNTLAELRIMRCDSNKMLNKCINICTNTLTTLTIIDTKDPTSIQIDTYKLISTTLPSLTRLEILAYTYPTGGLVAVSGGCSKVKHLGIGYHDITPALLLEDLIVFTDNNKHLETLHLLCTMNISLTDTTNNDNNTTNNDNTNIINNTNTTNNNILSLFKQLCQNLKQTINLFLDIFILNNECIYIISQYCISLKTLTLCNTSDITDTGFVYLSLLYKHLESLTLRGCVYVSNSVLAYVLSKLRGLKVLCISNCHYNITGEVFTLLDSATTATTNDSTTTTAITNTDTIATTDSGTTDSTVPATTNDNISGTMYTNDSDSTTDNTVTTTDNTTAGATATTTNTNNIYNNINTTSTDTTNNNNNTTTILSLESIQLRDIPITNSQISDLCRHCPNLKHISIENPLSSTTTSFSTSSELPVLTAQSLTYLGTLRSLISLRLVDIIKGHEGSGEEGQGSVITMSDVIKYTKNTPKLQSLYISTLYDIHTEGILHILSHNKQLINLELTGVHVSYDSTQIATAKRPGQRVAVTKAVPIQSIPIMIIDTHTDGEGDGEGAGVVQITIGG